MEQLFGQGAAAAQPRKHAGIAVKVGDVPQPEGATTSATRFLLCLLKEVQTGAFGYQNIPPLCSLGTNISAVKIIL